MEAMAAVALVGGGSGGCGNGGDGVDDPSIQINLHWALKSIEITFIGLFGPLWLRGSLCKCSFPDGRGRSLSGQSRSQRLSG